jgi:hypothetical protein
MTNFDCWNDPDLYSDGFEQPDGDMGNGHLFDGLDGDATKWGISDFYDENADVLKNAVQSGEPFDTGWFSCKKEVITGRVSRSVKGGKISVEVSECMDEARYLVDTDYYEATDKKHSDGYSALESLGLDDEQIKEVIESTASSCGLGEENCKRASSAIDASSSYDKVCEELDKLAVQTSSELEAWYQQVIAECKARIEEGFDE